MDSLPPFLLDGSVSAFIGIVVVWAIISGRLVPRRTFDDQVHEANEWRTESRLKDQQIAEKDTQLRSLAEVARTVDRVLHALPTLPEERR